jgi:hypothetical protein
MADGVVDVMIYGMVGGIIGGNVGGMVHLLGGRRDGRWGDR